MQYKITQYKDNHDISVLAQANEPELKQLQEMVGGLIEQVPEAYYRESNADWFSRQHKHEIDAVWCNEEGLLTNEPKANPFFAPAPWGDRLYGNVVVVEVIR
jgi:hypothetical protein